MSKHLTLEDRKNMESLLKEGVSFKEIGRRIGKDCTAVSKEIRKNYETKKPVPTDSLIMHAKTDSDVTNRPFAQASNARGKLPYLCAL